MEKFLLNYASIDGDGELYCECLGIFEDEASALHERNYSIKLDKEDYDDEEFYNSHIVKNTNTLYEWSDDEITLQYRIQQVLN